MRARTATTTPAAAPVPGVLPFFTLGRELDARVRVVAAMDARADRLFRIVHDDAAPESVRALAAHAAYELHARRAHAIRHFRDA